MAELSDLTARIEAALNDKLEPNAEIIRRFVQELETISLDSGDLLKSLRKFQEDNQTEFDLFLDALKTDQTNVYQWLLEMRQLKLDTAANAASAEESAQKAEDAAAVVGYLGEWTPSTEVQIGGIYGYQGSEWRSLTGADVEPVDGNDWRELDSINKKTIGQYSVLPFATVSDLQLETNLKTGYRVSVEERGGAIFEIKSSGTGNGYDSISVGTFFAELTDSSSLFFDSYGFVSDAGSSDTNNLPALQAAINRVAAGSTISSKKAGKYFFGGVGVNESLVTVTKEIHFDWGWSTLEVSGQAVLPSTGETFIAVLNSPGSMKNYNFNDRTYSRLNPSRGVIPFAIIADGNNQVQGFSVGPAIVEKGQSLLTCFSPPADSAKVRDISLIPPLVGENVYYGVNLANSGDSVRGSYSVYGYNRVFIGYGIRDVDVNFFAQGGDPTSGTIVVTQQHDLKSTSAIKIRGVINGINGVCRIGGNTLATSPRVNGIDIKLDLFGHGANFNPTSDAVVSFVVDNTAGGIVETDYDITVTDAFIDINADFDAVPAKVYTKSINDTYGTINFKSRKTALSNVAQNGMFHQFMAGKLSKAVTGDFTAGLATGIDSRKLISRLANAVNSAYLNVTAYRDSGSAGAVLIQKYQLVFVINSSGLVSIIGASLAYERSIGGYNPAISIGTSGSRINVGMTDAAATNGELQASIELVN